MGSGVNTVTGQVVAGRLGRTLMHEHLNIAFPGTETDTLRPGPARADMIAVCVDAVQELQAAGFASLLDPCPMDLGRDVGLMQAVASRTGFNIVCATGLYHEALGASAYWRLKFRVRPGSESDFADLMIREIEQGVAGTDVRAGVIKVATSTPPITDFERKVLAAAASACLATGAPILTHTDAVMGDEQIAILSGLGVPAHKILCGHCCGSNDHHYHRRIIETGAYIGFDRFGLEHINSDENRIEGLVKLIAAGALKQAIVSHDTVWCMQGAIMPPDHWERVMAERGGPLHFTRNIAPRLKTAGITEAQIETLLVDNPRRYFAGEPPPLALGREAVATA